MHNHGHEHPSLGGAAFTVAVAINVLLTAVEAGIGIYAGSTALIADALHNLNDAAALVLAWWARRLAQRQADERYTFGYGRAELVAALINLTALIVLATVLAKEAVIRLIEPGEVLGGAVAIAAGVAIVVDLATALLLWKLSKGSLNLKAAFLHNLSDAGISVAVLVGALLVVWTGRMWIDPVLTLLLVGGLVFFSFGMLKRSAGILMLASPPNLNPEDLRSTILEIDGIKDVHHLHVWEIDEETSSVEAHLEVEDKSLLPEAQHRLIQEVRNRLRSAHGIDHGTFQIEAGAICAHAEHDASSAKDAEA